MYVCMYVCNVPDERNTYADVVGADGAKFKWVKFGWIELKQKVKLVGGFFDTE